MGDFSSYNSHTTVHYIKWESMGFPINLPQYRKMEQNSSQRRTWEIGAHTFPILRTLFSIRFRLYGILHHMGNACVFLLISHNMGKDSQTHRMAKVWEIGSGKFPTKLIECGKPGKLVLILFPQYGCFFPIRFTFYGILYNMRNTWVSPSISRSMGKCSEIHPTGRAQEIGTHFFPNPWIIFFPQIPILWYTLLPHGKCMVFPIQIHSVTSLVVFPQYYCFYLFQNLLIPEKKKQKKPIR